ncbi:MAG: 16S rRNA (cytosine(1402)-N(4))-methyltransferase [Rhodospirillaceae bacterium]|nr:16S rRNA (cytosine(1402)-N(4))-methyltransferase [Rhodospirillaceae bacterium]
MTEGHSPVLLDSVIAAMAPCDGATYVDGTFGGGGYAKAILEHANCFLIGIDQDPSAILRARDWRKQYGDRFMILKGRFGDMSRLLADRGITAINGITLDLGVSSYQLDNPERGFSFKFDGPLDMRMAQSGTSATDIINQYSENELADIFHKYGEERKARKIARYIVAARSKKAITRTHELAEIIRSCVPLSQKSSKSNRIDPATRSFQALRIYVNDELGELRRGLTAAECLLSAGGSLTVVSFHSLEDRIVKNFLRNKGGISAHASRHFPLEKNKPRPTFKVISRRPLRPTTEEIDKNPRARSARLRVALRTGTPSCKEGSFDD